MLLVGRKNTRGSTDEVDSSNRHNLEGAKSPRAGFLIVITLIQREFDVDVSAQTAWTHLARLERRPTWAPHIKRVDVSQPGPITSTSSGIIHLGLGMKSEFVMTEFNPPDNWKWRGSFLSLTVDYDHRFKPLSDTRCRLIWVVDAEGFGASNLGRVFAAVYNRNLNRAIPRLIKGIGEVANSNSG